MNKNLIKISSFCFLSIFSGSVFSYNLCERNGYVVGFFNGVNNEESGDDSAQESLFVINFQNNRNIGGDNYAGEKVKYKLFYNKTENIFSDFYEVINQRYFEITNNYYEIVSLLESGDADLVKNIIGIYPESKKVLEEITDEIGKEYDASIIKRVNSELTLSDYKNHEEILDKINSERKRLILIAHSQGNLFLNHSYDYIKKDIGKENILALHIAPASRTLRGEYILSDNDMVINSLRGVYGTNSVPDNNVSIPFHIGIPFTDYWEYGDVLGHGLLNTYLNEEYVGLIEFNEKMRNMFFDLKYKSKSNNNGFFNAIITIKGGYDQTSSSINIVVKEPEGANPQNYGRYYNDMTGFKSSCESSEVSGEYEIGYNGGASLAGREAVLTITDTKGKEIAKRDFVIGEGLSQWWLLPKVDIGRVLVQKKNDSNEYEVIFK